MESFRVPQSEPTPAAAQPTAPPRATPALVAATLLTLLLGAVLLLEVSIRASAFFLPQPWRSVVREAARIPLSNTRTYGGVSIALPNLEHADLVVVGDSFAFGTYVAAESTYASLLAKKLNVPVANLGVSAQSPPTYNRLLEVGARFKPKRVIYALFGNDFIYGAPPEMRPLSLGNVDKALPMDAGLFTEELSARLYAIAIIRRLSNLSLAYQLFKRFEMKVDMLKPVPWISPAGNFYMLVPNEYWDGQLAWTSPSVRRAVDTNVALVREADRFTRSIGAEMIVLLQPTKEMVFGPLAGKAGEDFYADRHSETYREITARLRAAGVTVWDATETLRERAAAGATLYHALDGHFDEIGHAAIADWLASRLTKK